MAGSAPVRAGPTYCLSVASQPRDRAKTRERILDEAFQLFVSVGFAGTTLSEVERRVGLKVGTGSLYHHFRSKDELLLAAVEREVRRCAEAVSAERAATTWPEDPREQLTLAAQLTLNNVRRFYPLFRLVQAEGDRVRELRSALTAALIGSGALGSWADDPARLVTITAIAGYHLFEQLNNDTFHVASEHEFIAALVSITPAARPPGVDEDTYTRLSRARGGE